MAKFSSSAFYFFLVLFIVASVEVSKVPMVEAGDDCYSAWPNCTDLAACKHRCAEMYHGEGFCYDMPGTYLRQCKCAYPC